MGKIYVLDTNVLIQAPYAPSCFEENEVVIPLVVRYITSTVIYYETDEAFRVILKLGLMMTVLILFQCYCNYFIANYGHVMGAKIETDACKGEPDGWDRDGE